jgi:cyclophilin family peptidyl-prolyl cis-trans isomerase
MPALSAVLAAAAATMAAEPPAPPQLSVTLAPAAGPFYEKADLSVKLVFDNRALEKLVLEPAAFARERFTITDAKGRPPKPARGTTAPSQQPLTIEGTGTTEKTVNLSAWYADLGRRDTVWDITWSHQSLSAGLQARVIRVYDPKRDMKVLMETDLGRMTWLLLPEHAPAHVRNFVDLARQGYFDGKTIHRVVPGLQAEGGDPVGDGSGAFRNVIPAEIAAGLRLEEMGMVGALRPETSMTSDRVFFITLASNDFMRGRQTFFAQVVDGLDVVARLNQAPRRGTTAQDPYLLDPPVRILSVQVP